MEQNLKRSEEQGTQIFRGSASQAKILGWEQGRHVSVLVRRPVWLQQGGNEQDMKLGGGARSYRALEASQGLGAVP